MKVYRQGDIILEEVGKIPPNYYRSGDELAITGETGRAHLLEAPVYSPIPLRGETSVAPRIVVLPEQIPLTHPEHPALVIEPGIYIIRQVRTFESNRRVSYVDD